MTAELLRGVDVSRNQKAISWPAVPDRVAFALIGLRHWPTGELDWEAANNVVGCNQRGVIAGGYQRINPLRNTPEREAAMLVDALAFLDLFGPGRLLPAIDIEPVESGKDREAEAGIDMHVWVRAFFAAWMHLTSGVRILWYSSGSYYAGKYGGMSGIPAGVSLWPAHWSGPFSNPKNPTNDPILAEQWAGSTPYVGDAEHPALIHQYWSKGTVPGIEGPVDLDCLMPGVRLTDVMQ